MRNDDVIRFNTERWEALSEAGVEYAPPWLGLDAEAARGKVDPHDLLGDVEGRPVLCLAASGGQQSAAFLTLGAEVTVFDLSERQLEKDRRTASEYGGSVRTVQGDMQDLGAFGDDTYAVVWIAHGINFVPSARSVLQEAGRVLRRDGKLRVECTNPYGHGIDRNWTGTGYEVRAPYIDGAEMDFILSTWEFEGATGTEVRLGGPVEYRHGLGTIVNTPIRGGLALLGLWEDEIGNPAAEPGSWEHYRSRMPPWLELWFSKPSSR